MKKSSSSDIRVAAAAVGQHVGKDLAERGTARTPPDPATILLVNDDAGVLFALRAVLGDLDVQIVTADSGEQALLRLLKYEVSVILLDVKMARMDGFDTARLIRSRPRNQSTPIIFLTSHRATDVDRETGYAVGAVDYLFMPVAPDILKAKVQALLRHPGDAAEAAPGEAPCPRPPGADSLRFASSTAACRASDTAGVPDASEPTFLERRRAGEYVALLSPDARWLYANASYQARFSVPMAPTGSYLSVVHEQDRARVGAALAALTVGLGAQRLQYRMMAPEKFYFETDIYLIHSACGVVDQLVLVSWDITEKKEMEAYVLQQSFHDALTGLPNRLLLMDRLAQATGHRDPARASVAVLFIDIDHFKDINDTLGHAAGDRLLQDVAERLVACVRDGDTVARLGGDEFVVVLLRLHGSDDAAVVAEKMVANLCTPCKIDGAELHISPSIGIAVYPEDGGDGDSLLRNADTAMYHAKRDGGARFSFFTTEMQETAQRKLALGAALQRAIGGNEFQMHYQPKVCARSGAIRGFEALIRWPQAAGGWIPPSEFIPVAEESGRIESIGNWVIAATTRELQRWAGLGYGNMPIAVNLSALQLRRAELAEELAAAVQASGIAPSMLEIELTETGVMSNAALAIELLKQMQTLGFRISIDDFGTGYSSLAYLKRLPINKLKIDASFVRDIATDANDAAIVLAIITLAHVLELTVIAEGVETAEQAHFLVKHGCDEMQGNYFSAAVPNDEALALLQMPSFRVPTQAEGGP